MFGYEPDLFPGREPLEALGAGIELAKEDVTILAHFASFRRTGSTLVLKNGELSLDKNEIDALVRMVATHRHGDIQVQFHYTHKVHGIITLRGNVTHFFTDTDPITQDMPLIEPLPLTGYEEDAPTRDSASALKSYLLHVHDVLRGNPINKERARGGRDAVRTFDEVAAAQGALGQVRGRELMLMVLNALNRIKLQGLMDTSENQPYWPGKYRPFQID